MSESTAHSSEMTALAVRLRELREQWVRSFFPEVYNEDWLFLHDAVRSCQVSAGGRVRQAPYRPYADRSRAMQGGDGGDRARRGSG